MKCPVDGTDLTVKQKNDITINTCPKCKGVWLDRAELDKILAQSELEYPDFEDFKGRETRYESPGAFFGRFFEH